MRLLNEMWLACLRKNEHKREKVLMDVQSLVCMDSSSTQLEKNPLCTESLTWTGLFEGCSRHYWVSPLLPNARSHSWKMSHLVMHPPSWYQLFRFTTWKRTQKSGALDKKMSMLSFSEQYIRAQSSPKKKSLLLLLLCVSFSLPLSTTEVRAEYRANNCL